MNNGEIECNGRFRNLLAEEFGVGGGGGNWGNINKNLFHLFYPSWVIYLAGTQVRPRLLDLSIQSPILMQFISNIPKTKT